MLVTGGCGFIGATVVKALLDTGAGVTVVDRTAPVSPLDGVRYVVGDLTDAGIFDLVGNLPNRAENRVDRNQTDR